MATITLTVSQQMLEKMYQTYQNQIIKVPNWSILKDMRQVLDMC